MSIEQHIPKCKDCGKLLVSPKHGGCICKCAPAPSVPTTEEEMAIEECKRVMPKEKGYTNLHWSDGIQLFLAGRRSRDGEVDEWDDSWCEAQKTIGDKTRKILALEAQLSAAHEYMHHMEGNMLTQTLALARSNAQRDALRDALESLKARYMRRWGTEEKCLEATPNGEFQIICAALAALEPKEKK